VPVYYSDTFRRQLKRLSRKYRRIRADVQPLIEQLDAGETPGEQIQGTGYTVYKVRVANSDTQVVYFYSGQWWGFTPALTQKPRCLKNTVLHWSEHISIACTRTNRSNVRSSLRYILPVKRGVNVCFPAVITLYLYSVLT
jgi:mRNA-degrading endonuclease RelE of RelBE toxin-antitoxin system